MSDLTQTTPSFPSCAIDFHDKNFDAIAQQQIKLCSAASKFVTEYASYFSTSETRQIARSIKTTNINDLRSVISPLASKFAHSGKNSSFWAMSYACSFFIDATTTRWAFVTEEKRQSYLNLSAEFLEAVWIYHHDQIRFEAQQQSEPLAH